LFGVAEDMDRKDFDDCAGLGSGISLMTREEGMLSRTAARILKVEKTRENVKVVVALIKRDRGPLFQGKVERINE
jgi:hypothetical protein